MSYILYHPGEERDINLTSGGFVWLEAHGDC